VRLYIMRHGPAEDGAPSGRDADRSLSAAGRARVALVARELVQRLEAPARIMSSPLLRAMQTAEIVRDVTGMSHDVEIREELAPSEGATGLVKELVRAGDTSVLLVSHAPDVSILVQLLTGERAPGFSAGMVVALEVDGAGSKTRFTLDP
jgi:phosphohistidine phosphatase